VHAKGATAEPSPLPFNHVDKLSFSPLTPPEASAGWATLITGSATITGSAI
ncbi:MAG: hypothetical protein JHC67_08820, partial [Mycolicibacterium sp.]|nr:hypothetical protein [Mycolicibacterium sp.]